MELVYLFERPEDGVPLIADSARRRCMVHPVVILGDHVIHVGDELFLRFHQFADYGPVNRKEEHVCIFSTIDSIDDILLITLFWRSDRRPLIVRIASVGKSVEFSFAPEEDPRRISSACRRPRSSWCRCRRVSGCGCVTPSRASSAARPICAERRCCRATACRTRRRPNLNYCPSHPIDPRPAIKFSLNTFVTREGIAPMYIQLKLLNVNRLHNFISVSFISTKI